MLGFLEQLLEIVVDFITDIQGIANWIWDAVISLFNMFTTFSVLIPAFFPVYLPAGLVTVFAVLVSLSVVMAIMAAVGSNVRK